MDPEDAPDYYAIVENPMDFGTIKKRLEVAMKFYCNCQFTACMHIPRDIVLKGETVGYVMLSGRIWKNIGENIFRSYAGTTSENTNFHVLVA